MNYSKALRGMTDEQKIAFLEQKKKERRIKHEEAERQFQVWLKELKNKHKDK